jgi:hypothetical protein
MAATPSDKGPERAEKQHNNSSTGAGTSRSVTYCSVGIQTAPPKNAQEFQRIHGREPTDQELVSRMGTAAIGRFGPSANAHEIIHSASFPCPDPVPVAKTHADASFQTAGVAQCKMSIARTKAKASMMVNKQRRAALEAGYRVWSETKDEKIIHSEQLTLRVQFDQEGNATSGDVGSLLLPNIYGEEVKPKPSLPQPIVQSQQQELPHRMISFTKEVDPDVYTSNSGLTPPPTPPPAPLDDAARDRLNLRRVHTFAPSVPREDTDPYSIEDYGYIRAVPELNARKGMKTEKEVKHDEVEEERNIPETISRKDTGMLEVGGERFADEFIVYDPPGSVAAMLALPSTFLPTSPRKRKATQSDYESSRGSPKRCRTPSTQNLPDPPLHDRRIRGEERDFTTTAQPTSKSGQTFKLPHETERKEEEPRQVERRRGEKRLRAKEGGRDAGTDRRRRSRSQSVHRTPRKDRTRVRDMERSDRDPDHHRASRRRSRSPDNRVPRNKYRSRSRVRREAEDLYEAERQRNADRKKIQAENEAREAEERRHEKEEERKRSREAEERRHLEKEERRRAHEAEDKRKQEAEQKKKAREAEERKQQGEKERGRRRIDKEERRRKDEKEQDRLRRRDRERERSPERRKDEERRKPDADTRKPAEQEDPYAKARAAEVAKREQAFKENNPEKPVQHTRDRSIERAKRPTKEEKRDEEKAKKEDKKVSRPRPTRTARGELERYDPRKKFGR